MIQHKMHDLCMQIATIDADQLTATELYRLAVENNYSYLDEQGFDFILSEACRYGLISEAEWDALLVDLAQLKEGT